MFACKSLLESKLSEEVNWVLLDTTADSNVTSSFIRRLSKAVRRMVIFFYHLCFSRIDEALIFTADGFSFVEKGSMSLLAVLFGKRTILAPRSGFIERDLESSKVMRWFIPFVFKQVDGVICQGEKWKELFSSHLSVMERNKLVVVQNWLDVKKYVPSTQEEKNELPLRVLFLSWVVKEKGIYDLIHAASELKGSQLHYFIAGDGLELESCKLLTRQLGIDNRFHFLGWVKGEQKLALLRQADLYVLPSYFEGFPNSLMEAMACELAIISTKVGSIPDLVNHDFNGLLIDAGDQTGLAAALSRLEKDSGLRKRLALNARKTIVQNNSIEKAVHAFQRILNP